MVDIADAITDIDKFRQLSEVDKCKAAIYAGSVWSTLNALFSGSDQPREVKFDMINKCDIKYTVLMAISRGNEIYPFFRALARNDEVYRKLCEITDISIDIDPTFIESIADDPHRFRNLSDAKKIRIATELPSFTTPDDTGTSEMLTRLANLLQVMEEDDVCYSTIAALNMDSSLLGRVELHCSKTHEVLEYHRSIS